MKITIEIETDADPSLILDVMTQSMEVFVEDIQSYGNTIVCNDNDIAVSE